MALTKITGSQGTFTNFTSTGIDDNATSTAITINSSQNVDIAGTLTIDDTLSISNGTASGFLQTSESLLQFGTSTAGDIPIYTNNTERIRILSGGTVCINRTSNPTNSIVNISHPGSSEYGLALDSSQTSGTQYHMEFKRNNTQAGYLVSQTATTVALANSSDARLKTNIQNSNSAIQDLKNIQVRQFDWVDNIDTHRDFGFVAQELINVVPEAVTVGSEELNENGKPKQSWGIDYSHIVPRLVKVCQEQQTKIEELEARITALETPSNP